MNIKAEIESVMRDMAIAQQQGQDVAAYKQRLRELYSMPAKKQKQPKVRVA